MGGPGKAEQVGCGPGHRSLGLNFGCRKPLEGFEQGWVPISHLGCKHLHVLEYLMKGPVGAATPGVVRHICKCCVSCEVLEEAGWELMERDHLVVANQWLGDVPQRQRWHSGDVF